MLEPQTNFQSALIEEHDGGFSTDFMPSVPTPMAGAIFIMPSERIHPVEVSVPTMMKCVSRLVRTRRRPHGQRDIPALANLPLHPGTAIFTRGRCLSAADGDAPNDSR